MLTRENPLLPGVNSRPMQMSRHEPITPKISIYRVGHVFTGVENSSNCFTVHLPVGITNLAPPISPNFIFQRERKRERVCHDEIFSVLVEDRAKVNCFFFLKTRLWFRMQVGI